MYENYSFGFEVDGQDLLSRDFCSSVKTPLGNRPFFVVFSASYIMVIMGGFGFVVSDWPLMYAVKD